MTTKQSGSVGPRQNDAAERLLLDLMGLPMPKVQVRYLVDEYHAALAAERRATVERIKAAVLQYGFVDVPIKRLLAILDAAVGSPGEPTEERDR